MVLILIKKWLTGNDKEQRPLLPANQHGWNSNFTDDNGNLSAEGCNNRSQRSDSASSTATLSSGSWVPPRVLSDIIIGLSDGLTVPFALTAGLSSLGESRVVITGGLAELVSGAISMGLGGYLAATGELEYWISQVEKERIALNDSPELSASQLSSTLATFNLPQETIEKMVKDLRGSPDMFIQFMLRLGKGLEEPERSRQLTSALTMGIAYFVGGFIPLVPYFFTDSVYTGLKISVWVMAVTLFMFGVLRTMCSVGSQAAGTKKIILEGVKMMIIGGVAAASAWGLVKAIDK